MKKLLTLSLTLILALLCFTSCDSKKKPPSVKFSEDGKTMRAGGRSYVLADPGEYTFFFPESYNIYGKKEEIPNGVSRTQVTSSLSQNVISFGEVPGESRPVTPVKVYVSAKYEKYVDDFAAGKYASYYMFNTEFTEGYQIPGKIFSEDALAEEDEFSLSDFHSSKHYIVYGYDATDTLARPVGVILQKKYKYYYYEHKELSYGDMTWLGDVYGSSGRTPVRLLSKDSIAALRDVLDEGPDRGVADRVLRANLHDALKEDFKPPVASVVTLVVSVVVIVGAALFLLWYFYLYRVAPKMALSFRTYVVLLGRFWNWFIALFRKKKQEDVSKEEFKGMNISLTKEDLTWKPEDLPEDNTEALNRSFCPACGAKCDWTKPTCGACGAPLILGDRYKGMVKFEQDRTVHSPDGHVVDLSTVTRKVYLDHYAPTKLKKALNRHAFWFYLIASEYLLTFFIVFVELMTLMQSFWAASWILAGALAYLGCAVSFHRNKGLASTVIMCAGTLLWCIISFCSIGTLVGLYPVPYIVVECIAYAVPVFAAGLALYRVILLEQGYRDFMAGKIYQ